jgi:hypothetical protein
MTLRIYDSTGKEIFKQTGGVPLQMLNSSYSAQQLFSADEKHLMIKEFLARVNGEDSSRLRIFSTANFSLEVDIRFTEAASDVLTSRTAFFSRDSKSFFYTTVNTDNPGRKMVLRRCSLDRGGMTKISETRLCADPACQLTLGLHTIKLSRDESSVTFSGIVNTNPPAQPPNFVQVVRCVNASSETVQWYMDLPAINMIRKILYFKDMIGLQLDVEIDFVKLTNNQFENFMSLNPITDLHSLTFSNLYFSADRSTGIPVYYERTGNANLISFRVGTRSFGRNFFDLEFNRPDQIIERIPHGDKVSHDQFSSTVLKRAASITNRADAFNANDLPDISLVSTGYVGEDFKMQLAIKTPNPAKYLRIVVNGNIEQKEIPSEAGKVPSGSFRYNLYERLTSGENRFEISVVDDHNKESIPLTIVQNEFNLQKKPALHALVIAVGDYQDTSLNLKWVVNDGHTMADLLSHHMGDTFFSHIYVDSLFDASATAGSVSQWLKKMASTQPEDYVVVYFSGHGVLDVQKKLRLIPNNASFSEPYDGAIDYQGVLDGLDALPARQKLFLIDACHSGNFDLDHPFIQASRTTSFDFLQNMFTFSQAGKGTFVFTSCQGKAVVQDREASGSDQNGPFVAALREALAEGRASEDDLGKLWLSDLFRYVRERTPILAGRAQYPDLKVDNAGINWRLK